MSNNAKAWWGVALFVGAVALMLWWGPYGHPGFHTRSTTSVTARRYLVPAATVVTTATTTLPYRPPAQYGACGQYTRCAAGDSCPTHTAEIEAIPTFGSTGHSISCRQVSALTSQWVRTNGTTTTGK